MSEKHKNIAGRPDEFLQYRRKKMTGKGMNEFERHLQKDPFAEEAAEGFDNADPDQAERDLLMLQKQIMKRTSRHVIPWYGIAASVAVLMILLSVLVVINKKEPAEIAYAPPVQNKVEEKKPAAEAEKPVVEETMVQPVKQSTEPANASKSEKASGESTQAKRDFEIPAMDEVITAENAKEEVKPKEGLKMTGEPITIFVKEKAPVFRNAIVNDKAGDTTHEVNFDSDVSALNEIVVVGYGAAKKDVNENESTYTPPAPAGGRAEFDRYIRENIQRPDSATSGQMVVVVLDFMVRNNGIIDSIKVIRSPGSNFSDEAIRLLKEGPAWKPATENGNPLNDSVRIRIVFR